VLLETEAGLLLDNVAVRPELHGRGIGRALIGFAEAEARRRGHVAIRLYTHVLMTENIALYANLGFTETGRVTEKGFDRVYMEKDLR
jgi:ribosomal protein S18 acetylase RimI-like enzyme